MPIDFIAVLLGKFEKNEIYTFLVGCAVALSFLLKFLSTNLLQLVHYHVFLFMFLFLLLTGVVYLSNYVVVSICAYFLKMVFSKKAFIGRRLRVWVVESSKKGSPVRYFPAYRQYVELSSIVILVTCGLLLIFPCARFIAWTYFGGFGFYVAYLVLVSASSIASLKMIWDMYVFELCFAEKCFQVTESREEFLKQMNEYMTQ